MVSILIFIEPTPTPPLKIERLKRLNIEVKRFNFQDLDPPAF
jgi:hypothetical protein